jgi:hypothetical protein
VLLPTGVATEASARATAKCAQCQACAMMDLTSSLPGSCLVILSMLDSILGITMFAAHPGLRYMLTVTLHLCLRCWVWSRPLLHALRCNRVHQPAFCALSPFQLPHHSSPSMQLNRVSDLMTQNAFMSEQLQRATHAIDQLKVCCMWLVVRRVLHQILYRAVECVMHQRVSCTNGQAWLLGHMLLAMPGAGNS